MSELVAQSFPELAYLVMRENPDRPSFRLAEIVELAISLNIEILIESQYKAFTPEWIEVLNGGLKRDSGLDHANNDGRVCLFTSDGHVCTEPWHLSEFPIQGESYAEFRRRLRGTNTLKKSAQSKKSRLSAAARVFFEKAPSKVLMSGEAIHVIAPKDEDGDGQHYIYIFDNAVEYRSELNATHREGNLPAYFDFSTKSPSMAFARGGNEHRVDGPAIIFHEPEYDTFFVNGEECGDRGEESSYKRFASKSKAETGVSLSASELEDLRAGSYKGFHAFGEEWAHASRLLNKYIDLIDQDEAEAEAVNG